MLPIPATIGYLRSAIGRQLTASIAFDADALTMTMWRLGIITPPRMIISRLCVTEELVRQIEQAKILTCTVYDWLQTPSVEIVDYAVISPLRAIRRGHFDDVRRTADQLTTGAAHE